MFILFSNSKIHPKFNRYVVLLACFAVCYWLYFAFFEKALLSKLLSGQAMIIDLVFGLPLVLAMAIVIYALVYWSIKVSLILFFPNGIVEVQSDETPEEIEQTIQKFEQAHGEGYWHKNDESIKDPHCKRSNLD